MALQLEQLQAEVSQNTDVIQSAVTLLATLSQEIKDAGTDQAKLNALTNALDFNTNTLAAAIAANTAPAAEQPAPDEPAPASDEPAPETGNGDEPAE